MTWAPTADQILDLDGVRRRVDDFRFDLLDGERAPIGTLHPVTNDEIVISNDTDRSVGRQLQGFHLPASELLDINPLSDRVQAYMVLQNGAEYPVGHFIYADQSRPIRGWGTESISTLGDLGIALNQPIEKTYGWDTGGLIVIAMLAVALEVVSVNDIRSTAESGAVFGAPVSYPPGTNRLTILNDFTKLMGWLPPFFDREGYLTFVDVPDFDTAEPAVTPYEYGTRIIADTIVHSDTILDAPNRFVVYETSGRSTITGVYDVPSSAPHSAANRGFVMPRVEYRQGLGSTAAANKAAKRLAMTDSGIYEYLEFHSTADPRHDTWDVIQALGGLWLETAWSLTCRSGGHMPHTLRRVY